MSLSYPPARSLLSETEGGREEIKKDGDKDEKKRERKEYNSRREFGHRLSTQDASERIFNKKRGREMNLPTLLLPFVRPTYSSSIDLDIDSFFSFSLSISRNNVSLCSRRNNNSRCGLIVGIEAGDNNT